MRRLLTRGLSALLVVVVAVGIPAALMPAVPLAPHAAAQIDQPVQVAITEVTPSLVSPGTPGDLTVTAELTNTSGAPVTNLRARMQRGPAAADEGAVSEALGQPATAQASTAFTPVAPAGRLEAGQSATVKITAPMLGLNSLQLSEPGVYPTSLNLIGQSSGIGRGEVGTVNFLLPALVPAGAPAGTAPAAPRKPLPVSMLIPLVDRGRLEQHIPQRRPVLSDDELAQSLSPGGRLYEITEAVNDSAPQGSPIGTGLCFAIDPDLIGTALAMQRGYDVRQPDGGLRPGSGSDVAGLWLRNLKTITKGRCVLPLPYSDADVVALTRANLPDLVRGSMEGADLLRGVLEVEPRRDLFWPIDGALDEPTAGQLASQGVNTVLLDPSTVRSNAPTLSPTQLRLPQPENAGPGAIQSFSRFSALGQRASSLLGALAPERSGFLHGERAASEEPAAPSLAIQPIDPLLHQALHSAEMSAQNTLGALVARSRSGLPEGQTSVLAPPRRWDVGGEELRGLLSGMEKLATHHAISPTALPSHRSGSSSSSGTSSQPGSSPTSPTQSALPNASLSYPPQAGRDEILSSVLEDLAANNFRVGDLFQSIEREPSSDVERHDVTTPLRNGLLQATSSAYRGDEQGSRTRLEVGQRSVDEVFSGVQINGVDRRVRLTASNSPIPLTVSNNLPVVVSLSLRITGPPGVKVTDLGYPLKIPASGSRTFMLQTEFSRAGMVTIDVRARSKLGTTLGVPQRLRLESNAYGTVTLVLTITAASLLVLLSARRVIRRIRARQAPAVDSETTGSESEPESTIDATTEPGSSTQLDPTQPAPTTETQTGDTPDAHRDHPADNAARHNGSTSHPEQGH